MWEVSARVHPAKGRTLEAFQRHGFIRRTSYTDREESDSQAGWSRDEGQQDHGHPGTGETAGGFQSLEPVSTACREGLPSGAGAGRMRGPAVPHGGRNTLSSLPRACAAIGPSASRGHGFSTLSGVGQGARAGASRTGNACGWAWSRGAPGSECGPAGQPLHPGGLSFPKALMEVDVADSRSTP